jgi:hypothetical protein
MLAFQTEGEMDGICIYAIALVIILAALYAALFLYQRFYASKRRRQHPCRFCGQMVNVLSDCCRAPVNEGFPRATCSKCGKQTKMVCSQCRKGI